MATQITLGAMSKICGNLSPFMAQSVAIKNTPTPKGCIEVRKGLEGCGAPQSPVFGVAENAPLSINNE
jgi:hypothetical protein